ncbi:fermitin family homolog 2-like [Saccoglossus kowalevskii]|uniref:Fermitin family homolog 2-like n=1 Tax=Saccoglossus kowalevskii TaxID=10224 RepID=A0ABM0H0A0_SACKO|nr:PREDICTED: fermitin family homolog 2-like [Saccoglossus kowalevskii]
MEHHMFKLPDGKYADGSWELSIYVTDLQCERMLRVKGDMHIGGLMLQLVEDMDVAIDWSDHALWWPDKNTWLSRTRSTLDQCAVQADAKLHFTPMHKTLRIQLPDMQQIDMRADFSINVFNAVIDVCKDIGIRHPEELSFLRRRDDRAFKRNSKNTSSLRKKKKEKADRESVASNNSLEGGSQGSFDGIAPHSPMRTSSPAAQHRVPGTPGTPVYPGMQTWSPGSYSQYPLPPSNQGFIYHPSTLNEQAVFYQTTPRNKGVSGYSTGTNGSAGTPGSLNQSYGDSFHTINTSLAMSPMSPCDHALDGMYRPKSLKEKACINAGWLDSSRSLMQQGVRENDVILLRFKYFAFYDLDPKIDQIRINQIYEQAKWMILTEEVECTEEEVMMFAALQLQVNLQSQIPQLDGNNTTDGGVDDIDAALTDLQVSLEGTSISMAQGDITNVPELSDYLRFLKPKKLTLKGFKRYWFVFKDTHMAYYKSHEDVNGAPTQKINLKGCEITPDVNISHSKFGMRLLVPLSDGMQEFLIRCDNEAQYANWMAAFRLASKGKTMADSSYESEVQGILAFLSMQQRKVSSASQNISPDTTEIAVEDFVCSRYLKKFKTKQIAGRILEGHSNARNMSLLEAKMSYIKAWQALPEYGVTYFIVKFRNSKKEDLLGVCYNRLIKMDINSGDSKATWRYSTMTAWHVNWEVKEVIVQMEDENIHFACHSADCKIVHEFIGGYIFLSMRSRDQNQTLNEELFHKLTGGWF